jgi:hypothetical protein
MTLRHMWYSSLGPEYEMAIAWGAIFYWLTMIIDCFIKSLVIKLDHVSILKLLSSCGHWKVDDYILLVLFMNLPQKGITCCRCRLIISPTGQKQYISKMLSIRTGSNSKKTLYILIRCFSNFTMNKPSSFMGQMKWTNLLNPDQLLDSSPYYTQVNG